MADLSTHLAFKNTDVVQTIQLAGKIFLVLFEVAAID